jgi:ABC-2 type transport system permease protein
MTTLRETWLVFENQMRLLARQPAWALIALSQPLLYLTFFAPLLRTLAGRPGFPPGDAWQLFVPGLLVQLGIFGSLFVGFGLLAEMRLGIVERMRVTPASRLALLAGRVLRDTLVLVVQATLLVGVSIAVGLRAPALGLLAVLALVALLGVALSSLSYAAAMKVKAEDALAQLLNTLAVPTLLLSGILLPMSLAPRWLYLLSRLNPFSHVVDGARASVAGHGAATVGLGLLSAAGLAVVGIAAAVHTFRTESA